MESFDIEASTEATSQAGLGVASEQGMHRHTCKLLSLSANLAVQTLSGFGSGLSTFIFVGTLGPLATGGCTLGNMLCNITGYSLVFGMATALDSLCAQSFGAKQYLNIGLHTQRAILILTLCSLPCILVWVHAEYLLHHVLFIPSDIAAHAGLWTRTNSAGLWPLIAVECLKKFMQSRNIVWPAVVTTTVGLVFNICANLYVLRVRKWGFAGAAWVIPAQNWLHFIVLVSILLCRKAAVRRARGSRAAAAAGGMMTYDKLPDESSHGSSLLSSSSSSSTSTLSIASPGPGLSAANASADPSPDDPENDWPPLSPAVFRDWPAFLALGIPGAASLFIEWGSFELAAAIAGQLGAVGLAAHGVFMSTSGLFYMLPLSIAQATTTVAGHIVGEMGAKRGAGEGGGEGESGGGGGGEGKMKGKGEGKIKGKGEGAVGKTTANNNSSSGSGDGGQAAARKIILIGIAIDTSYGFLAAAVLLFAVRPFWGSIFTGDAATRRLVYDTMPFMALYAIVDASKCITLNILRSGGLPGVTVWVNFGVCVLVMVPLGYYLALVRGMGLAGLWLSMSVAWALATVAFGTVLLNLDLRRLRVIRD